jgi:hypothetical protein
MTTLRRRRRDRVRFKRLWREARAMRVCRHLGNVGRVSFIQTDFEFLQSYRIEQRKFKQKNGPNASDIWAFYREWANKETKLGYVYGTRSHNQKR